MNEFLQIRLYKDRQLKAGVQTVKTFENEAITNGAENLAKLYANDVYSAATMSIDNVYIK